MTRSKTATVLRYNFIVSRLSHISNTPLQHLEVEDEEKRADFHYIPPLRTKNDKIGILVIEHGQGA